MVIEKEKQEKIVEEDYVKAAGGDPKTVEGQKKAPTRQFPIF